jgi:hypothetical protein
MMEPTMAPSLALLGHLLALMGLIAPMLALMASRGSRLPRWVAHRVSTGKRGKTAASTCGSCDLKVGHARSSRTLATIYNWTDPNTDWSVESKMTKPPWNLTAWRPVALVVRSPTLSPPGEWPGGPVVPCPSVRDAKTMAGRYITAVLLQEPVAPSHDFNREGARGTRLLWADWPDNLNEEGGV